MSPDELDAALLQAHATNDHPALISLYTVAAHSTDNHVKRRFFLTQAYIFALEAEAPEAAALRKELIALGGER